MKALADPELIAEFEALGMSVVPADAETAFASLKSEGETLAALVYAFGVKPGDAPQ